MLRINRLRPKLLSAHRMDKHKVWNVIVPRGNRGKQNLLLKPAGEEDDDVKVKLAEEVVSKLRVLSAADLFECIELCLEKERTGERQALMERESVCKPGLMLMVTD